MYQSPPIRTAIALLFFAALIQTARSQNIGTALVNGAPQINSGRVEGNVQQMTGANVTLNGGAVITGDLLVPGTPTLIKNGQSTFGGTIVGTGNTSPSNYQVILNGGVTLGHLRTRANPVAIPALPPVPSPTGTRTVTITAAGQSAGNFATLRNFTLNGNVGQYAVPPGTYGDFIANAASGFTLGVAGSTQPAVYNLQHVTLNGATKLLVVGPVIVNVANGFTANGMAGTSSNPAWLKLNIVTGGFTVNGGCNLYGYATLPNGTLIINSASKLVGGASCNALTVNANGLLQLFDAASFENKLPTVAITSPAAATVFNTGNAITLLASAADADGSVAKVEFFAGASKLGEATSSPWTYAWQNAAPGSYQLTAIATDNLGAKATSAPVSITVNAPPTVALTAPANQSVFQPGGVITLTANAADTDGTIQKVEFFSDGTKLGEKTSAPYSFTWNGAANGPHALTAKATDNHGAQAVSAAINIRVNAAPAATMTAPANGSVVQAGSVIPLTANASDSDGTITKLEFYAGAIKVGEDTTAPYQFNWSNAAAGHYSLTARAIDNDGAQGTSTPINLTINAPPAVGITAPTAAQVFNPGAPISITANPSDSDGTVTTVEFFSGATKIGESGAAPWTISWPAPAPGSYQLSAVATDDAGAHTTSTVVSIRINTPPAVTITAPADQAVVQPGSSIPLTVNATDSDGTITKVEFFAGSTKLGESVSAPFNFAWSNAISGGYTITAKATDNDAAFTTSAPIHLRVNALPAVAFTTPAQGASFRAGDAIPITANATDTDDGITKVEFFAGATKVGEATAAPYSISWTGAPEGASTLTARATDGSGAYATSAAVTINVTHINSQLAVDAGPDRLISLPGAATLQGQVVLNGGTPGPEVTLVWSLVSGPGGATFSAPNSAVTSANFTQAGNYVIKLTASNADGANFDTTAVTVLAAPQSDPDSFVSNQGREFWMAFLSNPAGSEPAHAGGNLNITSETAATGTVEIYHSIVIDGNMQVSREVKSFSVTPGGKTVVDIQTGFAPDYWREYDQVRASAIHIVADAPVAVHALNYMHATTDGSLILPTSLLGLDHFVMSYRNGIDSPRDGSEFAVVATKPQTLVTITPTSPTGSHPAGQSFTVTLQTGEVYRLISIHNGEDLTGSRVQADKPIAVFSGAGLAYVPYNIPYADHLYEQVPSVDLWGRHFVTVPLKGRTGGDMFRALASDDNTHVSINGEIVATLNRGQFYETVLTQPAYILADQHILLAQLAQGTEVDHTVGDPFLSIVPPYETFGRHYIIPTPYYRNYDFSHHAYVVSDIYDSYLTVVVDSAHAAAVTVNGQTIALAEFFPIADSGFSTASIAVPKNSTLDISSPTPVGTLLYGWAPAESYGYTGGLYGAMDNASAQLQLTQSSALAPVGGTHRVTASLHGVTGLPVPDALVTFSVTGANPTTGSALTSPDGTVEFSWTGSQAGSDSVIASAGARTATIDITWVATGANQSPQVNAGPDAILKLGQALALHGLAQDDGMPAGHGLTLLWSAVSGLGDVTFSSASATDTTTTFLYPGKYRLRLTAYDGQFASDDDLSVLVDIPPQFIFDMLVPSSDLVDLGKQWTLGVTAEDRDGVIARIDLIEGSQILGTLEPNQAQVFYYWTAFSTVFNTVGTHNLIVRLTDDLGITEERPISVVVRPAPEVQILTPTGDVTLAAGDSITFTASASSGGGAITQLIYQDVTYYPSEIGEGTGTNYSFTWTPNYAGTFQFAATAYDTSGASGTSTPVTITVLSPGDPTVTITSPAGGSSFYPGQSATVHADASAVSPATVEAVNFYDGNDYLGSKYSPPYEVQWFAGYNGEHSLRADVYDSFGGYSSASITVNVVEPPPLSITLVEPTPSIPIKVNAPTTLAAVVGNVIGTLEDVSFYVNGQWIDGGTDGNATWTPTTIGTYQVEVYANSYDPYQDGYTVANVTVADLHPPSVQFTAPANRSTSSPGTPIVLLAQASDIDSNLAKFQLLADGQLLSDTPLSGNAGVANFTWGNAGPGWHNLTALASDDTIQTGSATLRVFVERTVTNDLLPPTSLTSEATSPTAIHLVWAPSPTTSTGTAIERRTGLNGVWEEIVTVNPTDTTYEDNTLQPETYYSYRLTSLDATGARSIFSQESSATTLVQLPQYAVVDLGESLEQSLVALDLVEKRFLYAQAGGPFPSAALLDLRDAEVMSIAENNDVLLKQRATTSNGQTTIEYYLLWHPDPTKTPDSIGIPNFRAFRLTRDGIVVGAMDHSTTGQGVPDWIYQGFEFWFGVGSRPGIVREGGAKIDVRAATWTPAGGVKEITGDEANVYRFDRLDLNPARKFPKPYDSLFSAWDISSDGTVVGTGSWGDLRNINTSESLDNISSYEPYLFQHGMRWKNNKWDTLGSLRRASTSEGESIATAISPDGKVTVGSSAAPDRAGDPPSPTHAMRSLMTFNASQTTPGDPILQDLLPLGNGSYAWGWDVDAAGNAVGYSTKGQSDPVYRTHAVWWQANSTAPLELPNLGGRDPTYFPEGHGYASAINVRGDRIVGKSLTMEQFTAGAVWALNAGNGGNSRSWEVHDLNAHVPSDWFVVNALDVNDNGLIVGTAFHTVPDPANPTGPKIQVRRGVLLVPVEFLEVTPKTKDDAGDEIDSSVTPKSRPESNELIKDQRSDQVLNVPNVAYRNLKIRVPNSTAGDKIKWSMVPLFTRPGQPEATFRGQWPEKHPDRFETNAGAGGGYGFERVSQEEARTQVDANGETAIRINVPPVGFNKVGVRLEIEKYPGATAEIDFDVPAVVVIDPGHGYGKAGSSNDTGATGIVSNVTETDAVLDIGLRLEKALKTLRTQQNLNIKIFLTRRNNVNINFQTRTAVARQNGADVYLSLHFTGIEDHEPRRHPLGMWDTTGNWNLEEDRELAIRLRQHLQTAIAAVEPVESQGLPTDGVTSEQHEQNLQKPLDTLSDSTNATNPNYNGNVPGYSPCRAALIELEWISNRAADRLFNMPPLMEPMRDAAADELANGVVEDVFIQPH